MGRWESSQVPHLQMGGSLALSTASSPSWEKLMGAGDSGFDDSRFSRTINPLVSFANKTGTFSSGLCILEIQRQ